jgi:NAD(P)-dependent dehydrogenase (short-subunit alcohol dehydrogenase family)
VSSGENRSLPLGAAARRLDLSDRVVVTPRTAPILDEPKTRAAVSGKTPLGQFALTNDVAGAIIYLASDAGRMVTGTILVVDGGWTAQ